MLNFLYNIIIFPLYQIIEVVYLVVDKTFKNHGIAVIGVSVCVTLLCLPLYVIAEKWQETERQKQAQMKGGIDRIKKAFKGDEQYMILSTFYKQNNYHPLMALRSSFSLLIQIPFFIAAYKYLSNLEELRGMHFLFINDMGSPDAMFKIGSFSVNVLPVLMTIINLGSALVYTKGFSLKEKAPVFIMPLLFLVILYNSPAGLVLYWTMNNVFSLIKNIFYKLKNPLKVLYFCFVFFILLLDYYLIFHHTGFLHRRIMLALVISVFLFVPLFIKGINFLLNTVFKPLYNDAKLTHFLYFISIGVLTVLIGLYIPSSVVVSSPAEFSFIGTQTSPFFIFRNSFAQIAGLFFCWFTAIYFLFGRKLKTVFSVLFGIVSLCALINAFIFAQDYGLLTPILNVSDAGLLKASARLNIINLLVLLIPVLLIFVAAWFKKINIVNYVLGFTCASLLVLSFVNFVKINKGFKETKAIVEQNKNNDSLSPIFHLSKTDKNILIIMLDRAINAYVPYILEEKPELKEKLDGFVFYPNTASFGRNTLFGASAMNGGYDYTPFQMNKKADVPLVQKHNESLIVMPEFFAQNGFDVTMTDSSWANYKWVPDMSIFEGKNINAYRTITKYTDYWLGEHKDISNIDIKETLMKRNFIWYGLLRTFPTSFRDTIYNDGFYYNTNQSVQDLQALVNNYAVLDYLSELTDFTGSKNTYTFIVNELTHEPAFLMPPDYVPSLKIKDYGNGPYSKDIHYHANIGALLRLAEYFDYLKQNGVYDNTRIIIVSDHATGVHTPKFTGDFPLGDPVTFNPILFFKDFDKTGSLQEDNTFMTNADVPSLSVKDLYPDAVNKYTGHKIISNWKEKGIILTDTQTWNPDDQNKNTFKVRDDDWYFVKEDITKPENWKRVTFEEALKLEQGGEQ